MNYKTEAGLVRPMKDRDRPSHLCHNRAVLAEGTQKNNIEWIFLHGNGVWWLKELKKRCVCLCKRSRYSRQPGAAGLPLYVSPGGVICVDWFIFTGWHAHWEKWATTKERNMRMNHKQTKNVLSSKSVQGFLLLPGNNKNNNNTVASKIYTLFSLLFWYFKTINFSVFYGDFPR